MKDKLRTFQAIWRTFKNGEHDIEITTAELGKDYILCAGKVTVNWKDVVAIEQIPINLLEFLKFDVSNIEYVTLVNMKRGHWLYALERFSVVNKEFHEYISQKYDKQYTVNKDGN